MQNQDLYDALKISKGASTDEIRKAFKRQAMEYHPDKTAGDKEKEEQFKKINEAYSVLSDPQKRDMYDKFGVVDGGAGGGPGPDISDLFKNMFNGGGGMPGGGGGFSFVFGGGPPGGGGGGMEDILGQMFGGGGGPGRQSQQHELIDVPISLTELYHGTTKKIEFEILDMCHKCQGSGAQDPSHILKCMMCKGEGHVNIQINHFMTTTVTCDSCGGQGTTIKNNKFCSSCNGKKTQYTKKTFELAIPKGISNGHAVRMNGKGSWNEQTKQHGVMVFRIIHNIQPPFSLQGSDVSYKMDVTLDELLCGFEKEIDLYGEKKKVISPGYFNPSKPHVTPGKGLPTSKKNNGNFVINWNVIFEDSPRLAKYNDVFQKVMKRKNVEVTGQEDAGAIVVI
jgi:DnaJ-class molecular chaperone